MQSIILLEEREKEEYVAVSEAATTSGLKRITH